MTLCTCCGKEPADSINGVMCGYCDDGSCYDPKSESGQRKHPMGMTEFLEKIKGLTSFIHQDWNKNMFVFHCKCGQTLSLEVPERAAEEWRIWNRAHDIPN